MMGKNKEKLENKYGKIKTGSKVQIEAADIDNKSLSDSFSKEIFTCLIRAATIAGLLALLDLDWPPGTMTKRRAEERKR